MYMHRHLFPLRAICLSLLAVVAADAASNKTPGTGRISIVPTFVPVEIPQSVYMPPATPKEGRNPFFPQSISTQPVRPRENTTVDTTGVVLNGITSPPRRTAMINGRTFEPGEEGEIKLPSGAKVLIKCEEIGTDSTVILINGARRELKLRLGV